MRRHVRANRSILLAAITGLAGLWLMATVSQHASSSAQAEESNTVPSIESIHASAADAPISPVHLVRDINMAAGNSFPSFFAASGSVIYFRADDGINGDELWKSDGTSAGTVLVKDIKLGAEGSWIERLTNANGTLYFRAWDNIHGD
jgi:ELWxxDGT repeat protein